MAFESAWLSEIRSCRVTPDQVRWANRGQTAAPKQTASHDQPTSPQRRAEVTSTFRFFACALVMRRSTRGHPPSKSGLAEPDRIALDHLRSVRVGKPWANRRPHDQPKATSRQDPHRPRNILTSGLLRRQSGGQPRACCFVEPYAPSEVCAVRTGRRRSARRATRSPPMILRLARNRGKPHILAASHGEAFHNHGRTSGRRR